MKDGVMAVNPLRFFLPELACEEIIAMQNLDTEKTRGIENTRTEIYTLEWDGDNVTRINTESTSITDPDPVRHSIVMTYDDKPNIYRGLYSFGEIFYQGGDQLYSKNNILTRSVLNEDGSIFSAVEYVYGYDDKGYVTDYHRKQTLGNLDTDRFYKIEYIEK